ncbi:MAG TPA: TRAP transporter substrate-binding protein [Burkholderiales bacterium]|nr:TRAP transporter substrate-binding protein [Burkholderiales bacterium]
MKSFLSAVAAILLSVSACVAGAADLTLRFGTPFVTNSNLHKAMEEFAKVVDKESGGKIRVQVYADSQIGDIQQLIAGMQLGTVDMAYLGVGNSGQLKDCGALNIAYLPYLFKNKEKATQVLNGPIMQEFYDACAKSSGVRIFAVAGARSPRAIVTTKGPIKKPEDLKGLRLRIPPIPIFRETFESLGVKVVPLGLNEVYMALSRGQVDGQDNGFDLTLTFRFHEVSKYWTATDHVYDVAAWYISERRWKSMTKEQQALFVKAAQIGGKVATDMGEKFDRDGMEELKKQGVIYTVPDKAAFEHAWKDVYKSYEGKVWPDGLVAKLKAAQK